MNNATTAMCIGQRGLFYIKSSPTVYNDVYSEVPDICDVPKYSIGQYIADSIVHVHQQSNIWTN